jgi:hypothetical protein
VSNNALGRRDRHSSLFSSLCPIFRLGLLHLGFATPIAVLIFPAKALQHLPFKELVYKASLLGEHAFDYASGKVTVNNTVTADPEPAITAKVLAKRVSIAASIPEGTQGKLDPASWLGRQPLEEIHHLASQLNPDFQSATSSSE